MRIDGSIINDPNGEVSDAPTLTYTVMAFDPDHPANSQNFSVMQVPSPIANLTPVGTFAQVVGLIKSDVNTGVGNFLMAFPSTVRIHFRVTVTHPYTVKIFGAVVAQATWIQSMTQTYENGAYGIIDITQTKQ